MKAARHYGSRDIRMEEIENPVGNPGEVVIRVAAAGICGSDMHRFRERIQDSVYGVGIVMGHELNGMIEEVDEGVTEFKPGDRVAVEPLLGCSRYTVCRTGQYHLCPDLGRIGGKYYGGFAGFRNASQDKVRKILTNVSLEEATILNCFAVSIHAINRVQPRIGDTVAIMGAVSTIGLSVIQVAKAYGACILVVCRSESSRNRALRAGADHVIDRGEVDLDQATKAFTNGIGVDIVYEAVGALGHAPLNKRLGLSPEADE